MSKVTGSNGFEPNDFRTQHLPFADRQRRLSRITSRFVNHPSWASVGAIVGTLGISVVFIGMRAESEARNAPAKLEVAAVALGSPAMVDGVASDSMGQYPDEARPLATTPVDVTLKNNGDETAVITEADAEVVFSNMLNDCAGMGAGPAEISANYSIKFPSVDGYSAPDKGSVASSPMKFEVKPRSVDRMAITVGPDRQSLSSGRPIVMGVRIMLVQNNQDRIDLGTVAIATKPEIMEFQTEYGDHDPECAAKNLIILDELYSVSSVRADYLDRLREKYQSVP